MLSAYQPIGGHRSDANEKEKKKKKLGTAVRAIISRLSDAGSGFTGASTATQSSYTDVEQAMLAPPLGCNGLFGPPSGCTPYLLQLMEENRLDKQIRKPEQLHRVTHLAYTGTSS